jgi:hypothetical protein
MEYIQICNIISQNASLIGFLEVLDLAHRYTGQRGSPWIVRRLFSPLYKSLYKSFYSTENQILDYLSTFTQQNYPFDRTHWWMKY